MKLCVRGHKIGLMGFKNQSLKTLGLYLDTLLIGHTFCSMVSKLSKFTLQKELHVQHFMTKNVFGQKSKTTTKQKSKQQSLPKTGIEPGTSRIAV